MKVAFYDRYQLINGEVPQIHVGEVEKVIQKLKESHVNEYIGSFVDKCKDRIEPMERDEFIKLYEKCKCGQVDQIAILSVSRLSRSTVTLIKTCKEFSEMGIEIMFFKEGITGDMLLKSETLSQNQNKGENSGITMEM